jgi:hypothetical protein
MKTIIYFTAKRARRPKMQGLATAASSASVIRELCTLAKCGKGRVYLVDAPTAEHGRRRIAAFLAGQQPDIGASPLTAVINNGRVVGIGADACPALAGASEPIRHWNARLRRDGRVKVRDPVALGTRSNDIRPSLPDVFGDGPTTPTRRSVWGLGPQEHPAPGEPRYGRLRLPSRPLVWTLHYRRLVEEKKASPGALGMEPAQALQQIVSANGFTDGNDYDSDDLPKGSYSNGGGEADTRSIAMGVASSLRTRWRGTVPAT